jgi:predicted O-methyltransferase YrrM
LKGGHPLARRAQEFGAIQKPRELSQILWLVEEQRPKSVLEIGSAAGGTLYCWCRLADPGAMIVSIDLPGGSHGGGYTPERAEEMHSLFPKDGQRLHLIQGDSHEQQTFAELEGHLDGTQLDFVFIDGDHTYEGVKQDFEMYSPLVRPGGIIGVHDICTHPPEADCHVDKFWHEVRDRYRHKEFMSRPHDWGGIGVVWKD